MTGSVRNKKAGFNYELLERYTAGVKLLGTEVKSVKGGQGSLEGAYVILRGREAFLVGATIPPFQGGNAPEGYEPSRPRKLLLQKRELEELETASQTKGLTILPISVYNKGRLVKVDIAIGRGKKKFDKRETIKKRDVKRDIDRTLKNS
ncbi:MAG: SsrA-binding protein [Candidatus Vogelbacteria bacterium RIFOXYD1_FULL_46_19]|uniref:SsrA-binding protein n=1 Tax=Candidatus Vogelbacteria bacterium RIFOXYD1_FULL_46_19 TaxID=1802439 RepID=A0A1G2QGT3_9BACT|nr:MAG: SsrA-binding protein [Candidatus Vogelbacteria bacterium RIFOXYD1_FULL_46_19]